MAGGMTPYGTTVTLGGSAISGELIGINLSGGSRSKIDVTTFATAAPTGAYIGGRKYIPGDLAEPSDIELEFLFDPSVDPQLNGDAAAALSIAWAGATADTWACTKAWVTGFSVTGAENDKITASVTIALGEPLTGMS